MELTIKRAALVASITFGVSFTVIYLVIGKVNGELDGGFRIYATFVNSFLAVLVIIQVIKVSCDRIKPLR